MKWLLLALIAFPAYSACVLTSQGTEFIEQWEGYRMFAYNDVGGLGTIGFGHLILRGETFQEPLLPEDAQKLLERDLMKTMAIMNGQIHIGLNENQCSATSDLAYNVGSLRIAAPTLLQFINQSRHADAAKQFMTYNRARINGKLTPVIGLTHRRTAESNLYSRQP